MSINEELLYKYIGEQIKTRRIALDLTQQALADKLKVKRTSITNIEAGMQRLPIHLLYQFMSVLDLELGDILPPRDKVIERKEEEIIIDGQLTTLPPLTAKFIRDMGQEWTTVDHEQYNDKTKGKGNP